MIKWVSQPFALDCPGRVSNPFPKSMPNSPNAGINTRNPNPAERFKSKGLYPLKFSNDEPASIKASAKMEADDFNVIG